jgi:nucleotide-binding universal stress UspA family protein
MAATKTPIASDSAAELRDLIGDDASATFESDPNFIDSNASNGASSEHLTLRDTDDTEDSDEEDEEEDEEQDEPDEEFDDEEEEEEDEEELAEMEDESAAVDADESVDETEQDGDNPLVDRAIDSALRMSALAAVSSEFAANVRGLE